MTADYDLTRAAAFLDEYPHRATDAVVLATAYDELTFMAEHGSDTQVRAAVERVKAAEFPGAERLVPIPAASVMVAAVGQMKIHQPSSRRACARTAEPTSPRGRTPDGPSPASGLTSGRPSSTAVRVRARRDDDHPPGA